MKLKNLTVSIITIITLLTIISPLANADTLVRTDFQQESFAKTVDYFDYVRAWATLNGIPTPANIEDYHANMYMTYVNTKGLQVFYAGLENVTFGGPAYFNIPMQSFIMHYKTSNKTRDVLLGSTFLMLLAFNETQDSIHDDSPDINDTLWASFSMGYDLTGLNATIPVLNSKTQPIPLTHSDDNLTWTWGMKYTNLTAFWWETDIDPQHPHFESTWPIAVTIYDELTFTYNLNIDPTTQTATLTENHIIGRMRDLLVKWIPFLWVHYNSTGTYFLGAKVPINYTIYDFIQDNQIKMSIVNFQTTILLDRETHSQTTTGQNVTDTETPVTDTSITTYADDGEKICDANFATKKTYKLYNYTEDPTETNYTTYNATTRTARTNGIAGNTGLFTYHIGLLKFLPLIIIHMYPQLYAQAKETITNMTHANYFYITAYPTYSGYRIEHDPTLTIYLTETYTTPPNWTGIIILTTIIAAATITTYALIKRRKPTQPTTAIPKPPT
jgi:hypothetical protein